MPTLNWIGKEAVTNHDKEVPFRLLKKVKTASIGENSQNLIIHGDNLEALKALMPFYYGKIKCIYIDPPYNTGNEKWVYNDRVNSPKIKQWLGKVVGRESEDLTRHDKWLCMMYPRLKLLRDLLKNDGVIAVSIGDDEVHHLKLLLNDIFGKENFEGQIHWRRRHNQPNDKTKMIAIVGEHILVYTRNSIQYKKSGVGKIPLTGKFGNPDNDPRGDWASKPWKTGENQSGTRYRIVSHTGKVFDEEWMGDKNTYESLLKDNRIIFPKKGEGFPRKKYFKTEREEEGQCATNWWNHAEFGSNQEGTDEIKELFDGEIVFENPKPTRLIKGIISICNVKDGDFVLDSFAGTGTTGHAVLDLNEDGQKRKFILIEMEDHIVIDITAERIKRAIKKNKYMDGFDFCKLDKALFDENGHIEETCDFNQFATYIYFTETQTNIDLGKIDANFIGEHNTTEYYLIYKGKYKNDLDKSFLKKIKKTENKKIIYADRCLIDVEILTKYNLVFKQIPYEVKVY